MPPSLRHVDGATGPRSRSLMPFRQEAIENRHVTGSPTPLLTSTPQAGYELAIKLARMGVKLTQPSDKIRNKLRAA